MSRNIERITFEFLNILNRISFMKKFQDNLSFMFWQWFVPRNIKSLIFYLCCYFLSSAPIRWKNFSLRSISERQYFQIKYRLSCPMNKILNEFLACTPNAPHLLLLIQVIPNTNRQIAIRYRVLEKTEGLKVQLMWIDRISKITLQ